MRRSGSIGRLLRRHGRAAPVAILTVALMLVSAVAALLPTGSPAGGAPLYPDLRTVAPSNLSLRRDGDGHYRIRFDNTVGNWGGRLEITVPSGTRDIYQNVYDAFIGGNRVISKKVSTDLIYHPTHNHFHFADFAHYELLRRNSASAYVPTTRTGVKTSFCILDSVRVATHGPTWREFSSCGATRQGLSAGWGDTYDASLPDQWVDLGTSLPSDGSYAIRSTADPLNRLIETNDGNNVGTVYFSIANGQLIIRGTPPLCTLDRDSAPVGATVNIRCNRFGNGEVVDIYWGSVNTDPRATVTSTSDGNLSAEIVIPRSQLGVHHIIARSRDSSKQAAAVFSTVPSLISTPTRGVVGSTIELQLEGFSADEQVEVRFYKTTRIVSSTHASTVDGRGGATLTIPIPAAPYGRHKVEAIGVSSGARAVEYVAIAPSITLQPSSAQAGTTVGASLRGFAAGEKIQIILTRDGTVLKQVIASHSGSATASNGSFEIPGSMALGTYRVTATGTESGVSARTFLTVARASQSEDPTATPSIEPTATATGEVTATPTDTATIEPTLTPDPTFTPEPEPTVTETPVPNASPIADAGKDIDAVDDDGDGFASVVLDSSDSLDPDGDQLQVTWALDGEMLSTEAIAEHELPVGVHEVSLSVTDGQGASGVDEVVVSVSLLRPPSD
jgi:hypothetical protein